MQMTIDRYLICVDAKESTRTTYRKVLDNFAQGVTQKLRDNENILSLRNYAMLNLMLRTGLRTIEVSRADVGAIVLNSWTWACRRQDANQIDTGYLQEESQSDRTGRS